jgi:site-specific DNA recombinase
VIIPHNEHRTQPSANPPVPALSGRAIPGQSVTVPLSGPSGLSDLAVSPFGAPTALLRGEVRVAWVGRTSTEEQQDPRQSLIRQLNRSKEALPEAWAIVAHFYDVESGRMELDARGLATGHKRASTSPSPAMAGSPICWPRPPTPAAGSTW